MALIIDMGVAVAALNATTTAIGSGANDAKVAVYSGAIPDNVSTAIGAQVKLIEFELPDPAFGEAEAFDNNQFARAEVDTDALTPSTALADGEATFFRIFNGDDVAVVQGEVTAIGAGGMLELSSTNIVTGVEVVVVSLAMLQRTGYIHE